MLTASHWLNVDIMMIDGLTKPLYIGLRTALQSGADIARPRPLL